MCSDGSLKWSEQIHCERKNCKYETIQRGRRSDGVQERSLKSDLFLSAPRTLQGRLYRNEEKEKMTFTCFLKCFRLFWLSLRQKHVWVRQKPAGVQVLHRKDKKQNQKTNLNIYRRLQCPVSMDLCDLDLGFRMDPPEPLQSLTLFLKKFCGICCECSSRLKFMKTADESKVPSSDFFCCPSKTLFIYCQ